MVNSKNIQTNKLVAEREFTYLGDRRQLTEWSEKAEYGYP